MVEKNTASLLNWLTENLETSTDNNFVDLQEICKKFKAPVSGLAVGNSIKQIFKNVKIQQGRAKDDWTKRTKRYYGINWKTENQSDSDIAFSDINTVIPGDLFILSKLLDTITLGHFTGDVINGSKVLLEIVLKINKKWEIVVRGKTVEPASLGISEFYNVSSLFDIVRQLKFCCGVPKIHESKNNYTFFKEYVSKLNNENSSVICFRSEKCSQILPFRTSNVVSLTCTKCKKLERCVKSKPTLSVEHLEIHNDNKSKSDIDNNLCVGTCTSKESTYTNTESTCITTEKTL